MGVDRDALLDFARRMRSDFERHLADWVEIPSVSAEPERAADVRRQAERAVETLRALGAEAELVETAGHPLVLGHLAGPPGAPTVLLYNHLDVQPADEPSWTTPPFELQLDGDGDVYRGRGTTDDKGPALVGLLGALAARDAGVPIDVRFLWDSEEEIGSPSLAAVLEARAGELACDSVLVGDTIWLSRDRPSTPVGLRGILTFSLELQTARHDTHAGLVGGAARNPLAELMGLVAALMDVESGEVRVPGFYDEAEGLTVSEALEFARSGFSLEGFMEHHGLHSVRKDDPLDVMNLVWVQPTMEVHAVVAGRSGRGVKASVPGSAEVQMSCRLVPNMSAEGTLERIRAFVAERAPEVVVKAGASLPPYRARREGPYAEALREAYQFAFGARPSLVREGGSIAAVPTIAAHLCPEVYFLGLSLPEHGYHAPNEHFDWGQAEGGVVAVARYLEQVAAIPVEDRPTRRPGPA